MMDSLPHFNMYKVKNKIILDEHESDFIERLKK